VRYRVLQNPNCVMTLEHWLSYNLFVRTPPTDVISELVTSTVRSPGQRRVGCRFRRASLLLTVLLGVASLTAACGGGPSGSGVASLGTSTTSTTVSATIGPKNLAEAQSTALRYIACLRTHGEPNMPEPDFSGRHVSINITASSGVNPNSPQFAAASNACKHLLPNGGVSKGDAISSADQADYIKAAMCMRSHGITNFPDPTFQNDSVAFNSRTPIDANSPEYKSALATCERLIPAGLPYSSPSNS